MTLSISSANYNTVWGVGGGGTWQDWGAGGGSAANSDIFVYGSSRARKVSNGIKGFGKVAGGGGGEDWTGRVVQQLWLVTAGVNLLNTRANGGVAIRVEDTSGNISDWYVDGSDTYTGGWRNAIVDLDLPESANNGTAADLTAVYAVGMVWDMTAGVGGGDPNCYVDRLAYWPNTGIVVTGDTLGPTPPTNNQFIEHLEFWSEDSSGAWPLKGLVTTVDGVTTCIPKFVLSPGSGGFYSTDERVVFRDLVYDDGTNVRSAVPEIGFESGASETDPISFTRLYVLAESDPDITASPAGRIWDFSTASDLTLDTCQIIGFNGTNGVQLGAATNTISFTSFVECGQVQDTGAEIRGCTFRNTTDADGAYQWTTSTDMADCRFFSDGTGHGIDIASAPTDPTTTNFDNIVAVSFGANDTANAFVDNNTGHDVLIAALNGSSGITVNTTTNTAVQTSVNVTFNGIVSGSRLYIEAAETVGTVTVGDELENVSVTTDPYTYVHSYEGDLDITYNVRRGTTAPLYKPVEGSGTIGATGVTFFIQQVADE